MRGALATIVAFCAIGFAGGCGFGDDGTDVPGAALTPPESAWLPGQKPLTAYPKFARVLDRSAKLAEKLLKQRELALERIEQRKIADRKRADAAARRRYLEAKRRAERAYRRALAEAARKRRAQQRKIAEAKRKIAAAKRRRERALRVDPGEECKLPQVRKRFECRRGRLPDPAGERKKRRD
jgi:vacuolar-type H+-ATPase subunit I/STV1